VTGPLPDTRSGSGHDSSPFGSGDGLARVPRVIGAYEVTGELGRGAGGVVFRARHTGSGQEVALKVSRSRVQDVRRRERFEREARITASLRHPGIVAVHSVGVVDDRPYLACELVRGARTLDEVAPELDLRARVALVRDAAAALGHAHAAGVVHRDVKPQNLLVDGAGRMRVADFGLAAAPGQERLTQTGAVMGTPCYMAPELAVADRAAVGPATDVWGLAVVLYELLTGELPFTGDSFFELAVQIRKAAPTPPSALAPEVDGDLDAVVARALARDPERRTPDGATLAEDLDRWLRGEGRPARARSSRRTLAVVLVAGAAAAVAGAGLVWDLARAERREARPDGLADPGEVDGPGPDAADGGPAGGDAEAEGLAGAPEWFQAAATDARPRLPLPPGLRFGRAPGEYVNAVDGQILVWVPATSFEMGAAWGKEDISSLPHGPPHGVAVTRGFFIGRDEVTWARFHEFCAATGRAPPEPDHEVSRAHPVHGVTWHEAAAYCDWAALRLPTEAEWELAARGADGRRWPWGDVAPSEAIRCNAQGERDGFANTSPVGSFPKGASPFGCRDVAGNVWEWIADWHAPYGDARRVDPTGPLDGTMKVIRGGSFISGNPGTMTTARSATFPDFRRLDIGFRAARDGR